MRNKYVFLDFYVRIDLNQPAILPLFCGDINTIGENMISVPFLQPDVPVDACPRIPSAVWTLVHDLHHDFIFPFNRCARNIVFEG
ncbi:hypothetical protein D3C77_518150 [compost metagenome]